MKVKFSSCVLQRKLAAYFWRRIIIDSPLMRLKSLRCSPGDFLLKMDLALVGREFDVLTSFSSYCQIIDIPELTWQSANI